MANGPDHLVAEYGQLVEFLELYPNISIVRTEGEPPDEYEIAYALRAYTSADGSVQVGRQHRVLITLPFGFPHFAPGVKALTPLFHPAIDQNDIAIEDQWRKKPSLPELVIYIAELISGHIYVMDAPVNPEAAKWYEDHKHELPLDTLTIANMGEESLIGILEKEFDPALNLDEDIHGHEAEIQEIRELLASNHLHTLHKRLNELPPGLWFPEREEAEQKVEATLQQTAELFAQAQELEEEGRYGKALECAQAILALIPDDPAAKSLAQRLQQSSFITDSLTDALNDQENDGVGLGNGAQPTTPPAPSEKVQKASRKLLLPEGFPLRTVLLVTLAIVALLWLGMQAMNDWFILSRVQNGIREGQSQLQAKDYPGAKDTLERTRQGVSGLSLLWFRESSLHKEIDTLLNIPELKEGAQGRVLYKGKYIDEATAKAQEQLAQFEQMAQQEAAGNQYDEALLNYNKALGLLETLALPQEQQRIRAIIHSLEVEKLLDMASKAEQQHNWDEARELYRQTESLLQNNGRVAQDFSQKLNQRIVGLEVRQMLDKAFTAMENDQLDIARTHLKAAEEKLAASSQTDSGASSLQLDSAHVQLQMYAILPEAKRAFENRQWRPAADQYQQAIALLDQSRPEVRTALQGVRGKLQRTLELSRINQTLEEALLAERKKDWPATVRLEKAALAQLARGGNDPAFAELKRRVEEQLAQHKQELELFEKSRWLEVRGLDFFRTNYPTFKESALSTPKAVFLRREGSKQIFELSSIDSSGGRPSKLVLLYAFDQKTGQWAIFRE